VYVLYINIYIYIDSVCVLHKCMYVVCVLSIYVCVYYTYVCVYLYMCICLSFFLSRAVCVLSTTLWLHADRK
jgi:hypothetical protein